MKFIIPILEEGSVSCKKESIGSLRKEFRKCRKDLEEVVKDLSLPIKTTEDKEELQLLQDLTNQLFDLLYLSFTLLDRLEDVQRGIVKTGERNLIKNIYDVNWRIKKIVEIEI